jgi:hypothetical protein
LRDLRLPFNPDTGAWHRLPKVRMSKGYVGAYPPDSLANRAIGISSFLSRIDLRRGVRIAL